MGLELKITKPQARRTGSTGCPLGTGSLSQGPRTTSRTLSPGAPHSIWLTPHLWEEVWRAPQREDVEPRVTENGLAQGTFLGWHCLIGWSQPPEEDLEHFEEGAPNHRGSGRKDEFPLAGTQSVFQGKAVLVFLVTGSFKGIFSRDQVLLFWQTKHLEKWTFP